MLKNTLLVLRPMVPSTSLMPMHTLPNTSLIPMDTVANTSPLATVRNTSPNMVTVNTSPNMGTGNSTRRNMLADMGSTSLNMVRKRKDLWRRSRTRYMVERMVLNAKTERRKRRRRRNMVKDMMVVAVAAATAISLLHLPCLQVSGDWSESSVFYLLVVANNNGN